MRLASAILALCVGVSARAAEPEFAFRGQWQVTSASRPNYVAIVLIDGQRRATWDSPEDNGRPAKFLGYVRAATDTRLDMVLTDRAAVVTIDCIIESSDLLRCLISFRDGKKSPAFALTRVGAGPASLAPKK